MKSLTIGHLAKQAGVNLETVRYYQRMGEDALTRAIITLASEYGRYGYRRITALLQMAGGRWARIGCSASRAATPYSGLEPRPFLT